MIFIIPLYLCAALFMYLFAVAFPWWVTVFVIYMGFRKPIEYDD